MVIGKSFVDAMLEAARGAFPNEACGLLAVSGQKVTRFYLIDNADASPVHYRMESQQQLQAMMDLDDNGWELGGIFHSHTRTRAFPSETDIRLAAYPEALYVIASLASQEHPEVRAFRIVDQRVEEQPLEFVS